MGNVERRRKSTETIPNYIPSSSSLLPLGYCRELMKANTTDPISSPWESKKGVTTIFGCQAEIPKDISIAEAIVTSGFMTTIKNLAAAFVIDWAVASYHKESTRPVLADTIAVLDAIKHKGISVSPSLIRKRDQLKRSALIPISGGVLVWLESIKRD